METLVQIGNLKKRTEHHYDKKSVIKKLQNLFPEEWDITGGLSVTTKMPGFSIGIPAKYCITGSKLAEIGGSVCNKCYAFRGHYNYTNVIKAQEKRMFNLNHPLWVPAMVKLITAACEAIKEPYFRWHDVGDLQGVWHLQNIMNVCELTPQINHWLPTREYAMFKGLTPSKHPQFILPLGTYKSVPKNLVVRFSSHMVDGVRPSHHWNTSSVSSNKKGITGESIMCEAYNRAGFCGDCRACWNKDVVDVTYPKH